MSKHEMVHHTESYMKQYGYAHNYSIKCSCGYESFCGESPEKALATHRQQVIDEKLGISFSVKQTRSRD